MSNILKEMIPIKSTKMVLYNVCEYLTGHLIGKYEYKMEQCDNKW